MRAPIEALALILALGPATQLAAQDHPHDHASPYAGFTDREIKALSAEEVEGLLSGAGLGMALPGELNRYPGPTHVLQMAPILDLSPDQEDAIRTIFEEMQGQARALGKEIVERERELDQAFAQGTITDVRLEELVGVIARSKARLRVAHLRAHLRLRPILTESQIEQHERLRGYAG